MLSASYTNQIQSNPMTGEKKYMLNPYFVHSQFHSFVFITGKNIKQFILSLTTPSHFSIIIMWFVKALCLHWKFKNLWTLKWNFFFFFFFKATVAAWLQQGCQCQSVVLSARSVLFIYGFGTKANLLFCYVSSWNPELCTSLKKVFPTLVLYLMLCLSDFVLIL